VEAVRYWWRRRQFEQDLAEEVRFHREMAGAAFGSVALTLEDSRAVWSFALVESLAQDFRYALEDEVRDMERQTRIREEEIASAAQAAQAPVPMPATAPEGSVPRETPAASPYDVPAETVSDASHVPHADSGAPQPPAEALSAPHEKSPDDHTAV